MHTNHEHLITIRTEKYVSGIVAMDHILNLPIKFT